MSAKSPPGRPTSSSGAVHAEASVQRAVEAAVERHRAVKAPLLEVLHAVQEQLGWIPEAAIRSVAQALNLSRAEVHGVVSFYPDFRSQAGGKRRVQWCRAEACQARGARALEAELKGMLGLEFGQTRADGAVSLEAVYCLGNCALGPSARFDGQLHGRITQSRLQQLLTAEP